MIGQVDKITINTDGALKLALFLRHHVDLPMLFAEDTVL